MHTSPFNSRTSLFPNFLSRYLAPSTGFLCGALPSLSLWLLRSVGRLDFLLLSFQLKVCWLFIRAAWKMKQAAVMMPKPRFQAAIFIICNKVPNFIILQLSSHPHTKSRSRDCQSKLCFDRHNEWDHARVWKDSGFGHETRTSVQLFENAIKQTRNQNCSSEVVFDLRSWSEGVMKL